MELEKVIQEFEKLTIDEIRKLETEKLETFKVLLDDILKITLLFKKQVRIGEKW